MTTTHPSPFRYTEAVVQAGPPAVIASPAELPVFRVISYGLRWRPVPVDVQLAIDLRSLITNPMHLSWLRGQTGFDWDVREFVMNAGGTEDVLAHTADLAELVAQQITPIRQAVGIGIGCDWGRQRSVVVAAELASRWNAAGIPTEAIHLDIQRPLPADHA